MVQEIDKIQKYNIQKIDKDCFILQVLKRLFKNKLALAGGIVVLLFLIVGCLAPVIAPHDPLEVNVSIRLQGPSQEYWLGTDHLGRCILSRLLYGAQTTLLNSLVVLAGILLIGIPLGLISGFCGGWIDNLIMRFADIVSTFPQFVSLSSRKRFWCRSTKCNDSFSSLMVGSVRQNITQPGIKDKRKKKIL